MMLSPYSIQRIKPYVSKSQLARAIYRKLKASHLLYKLSQMIHRHDAVILKSLPEFVPNSQIPSTKMMAALTLQSAHQTFLLVRDLILANGCKILSPIEIRDFTARIGGLAPTSEIKRLFDQHGSDKSTTHDYHLIYESILPRPNECRAILEVGLGTNNEDIPSNMGWRGKPGASLRAFRDYLPQAQVFGADVDKRILFEEDRIKTFFVDQTDIDTVFALGSKLPDEMDLIIDDGLHSPNANLSVLILAIKKTKIGGWLIIEDISRDSLPIWQVVGFIMPDNFEPFIVNTRNGLIFAAKRLN